MERVLIIHEVADYEAWKQVFDTAAGIRQQAGERDYEVLRAVDDPDLVVHLSTWTSTAAARGFFESDELVRIRAEAGVRAPRFHYLDQVETGTLGELSGR